MAHRMSTRRMWQRRRLRGSMLWRQSVVLPGVTSCLQRCLPWRRYPLTTTACNSDMTAVDCVSPANLLVHNAVDSGNAHSNILETILDDVPPAERPYKGLYCGSSTRASCSAE